MKNALSLVVVIALSATNAFGQSIDKILGNTDLGRVAGDLIGSGQARQERNSLKGIAAKYNADQSSVTLRGETVNIRRAENSYWASGTDQLKSEISRLFTQRAVDAFPVWDTAEISTETQQRRDLRGNDEVDQTSLPSKGTLRVARLIAEVDFVEFDRSQQFNAWWGSWARSFNVNLNFSSSRETSYFGLTLTIRRRDTGEVLAVYKTMGVASSADNVSGSVAAGFFGGYNSNGSSTDERQNRALQNAIREMADVLRSKAR